MHRTFGKVWIDGSCDVKADRQTDRRTDTLITILRSLPKSE